jgi:twinkle protein
MTPKQISNSLSARAEDVARMLLPGGKKDGSEWRAGSAEGDAGKSLGVCVSGTKAGVWSDFATGDSGDLLDLWCASKSISLADAIKEAKAFLGIVEPEWEKPRKKFTAPAKPKCSVASGAEITWLTQTRKLSEAAISAYQIAAAPGKIIFPFKRSAEKSAAMPMCKWRSITEKKGMPTSKDQQPSLFGWQAIPKNAREVTICEGELDAPSLFDYGYPALSVPFGGGRGEKQAWIEYEYEALEQFDVIYVCMDADGPGREGAKEIIERLGRERCRMVNLPAKDANDCLKEGVPQELVDKAFRSAPYMDPAELKSAADYFDEILWALYPEDAPQDHTAILPPWPHAQDNIQFRMSELMVLVGVNGHGKTAFTSYLTLNSARSGAKCCLASMEMKPGRLLANMTRQAAGMKQPTKAYAKAINEWYRDKIWMFDCLGTAKVDKIMETFVYARKRYGVTWFVIDSMMKCGIDEDDYNGQKRLLDRLADFKNEHNVFVCLLHHIRKSESEYKPSGKMDVKGTGAITDLADTVGIIWRNKPKEEAMKSHEAKTEVLSDEDYDGLYNMPDAIWRIVKQRNHPEGWEGKVSLFFDTDSLQYRAGPDAKPFQYVNYSGDVEVAAA